MVLDDDARKSWRIENFDHLVGLHRHTAFLVGRFQIEMLQNCEKETSAYFLSYHIHVLLIPSKTASFSKSM